MFHVEHPESLTGALFHVEQQLLADTEAAEDLLQNLIRCCFTGDLPKRPQGIP